MYNELENIIKDKSLINIYRNITIVIVVCVYILFKDTFDKFYEMTMHDLILIVVTIIILMYCLLVLILFFNKKIKKENWKKIINPVYCIYLFEDFIKEKNIKMIVETLIEYKVTDKESVKLIIDHYRSLIISDVSPIKGIFVSTLPIVITILTYISPDGISLDENKLISIIAFISFTYICCFIISVIVKELAKFYGKNERYKILENALTDIYLNYSYYIPKYRRKISLYNLNINKSLNYNILSSAKYDIVHINKLNFSNNSKYVILLNFKKNVKKMNHFYLFNEKEDYIFHDEQLSYLNELGFIKISKINSKTIMNKIEVSSFIASHVIYLEMPYNLKDEDIYTMLSNFISCL